MPIGRDAECPGLFRFQFPISNLQFPICGGSGDLRERSLEIGDWRLEITRFQQDAAREPTCETRPMSSCCSD